MESNRLETLAHKHGIRLLLQFGSTVTGRTHPGSDVDLAVLLDEPSLPLQKFGELLHDLQAFFPDQEVDLAVLNRADPLFLKKILETARLLYGQTRHLAELRIYGFKRYQDHRKYLALEREYVDRVLDG